MNIHKRNSTKTQ